MKTDTTEPTPAQARRSCAAEQLQAREAERANIPVRKRNAEAAIERLNREIVEADRSGDKKITTLRKDREEHRQILEDLEQSLPAIDRDLELARGEFIMAKRACGAERYNAVVSQQAALYAVIEEALETITKALDAKHRLAMQRHVISSREMECPQPLLDPDCVQLNLMQAIQAYLEKPDWETREALRRRDWTCRQMHEQGSLLEHQS